MHKYRGSRVGDYINAELADIFLAYYTAEYSGQATQHLYM